MSKYINADELKRILKDYEKKRERIPVSFVISSVNVFIDDMPAADVEPVRHGKWIHDGRRENGIVDWYHCSVCGAKETGVCVQANYCCICGCKMDGGSEE